MRKKSNSGIFFSLFFVFILLLMLIFGHWQLSRQANKMDDIQQNIIRNNNNSVAIVNFINAQFQEE